MLRISAMKTKDAIDLFDTPLQLAAALGITRAAIYQWGETVPPLREYQIKDLLAARSREACGNSVADRQHEAA